MAKLWMNSKVGDCCATYKYFLASMGLIKVWVFSILAGVKHSDFLSDFSAGVICWLSFLLFLLKTDLMV